MNQNKSNNSGYLCFMIASKYLGIQISSTFDDEFNSTDDTYQEIISTAKKLKLKVSAGKISLKRITASNVPVIAKLKDGRYNLLLGKQNDKWIVLNPLVGNPESIDEKTLHDKLSGYFIIIGKKKFSADGEINKKFGFRWFIPTILKFKKQFISVLIAVFTIQILGILTPLMTQVVWNCQHPSSQKTPKILTAADQAARTESMLPSR